MIAGASSFSAFASMPNGVVNTSNVTVSATLTIASAISDNTDITSKFTDESFRDEVYTLIGKTSPEPILYSDVKNLEELYVASCGISNLSGIEYFTKLSYLDCEGNQLTTLYLTKDTWDVSKYGSQYTDSSQTTRYNLVITIKN